MAAFAKRAGDGDRQMIEVARVRITEAGRRALKSSAGISPKLIDTLPNDSRGSVCG
jgi:hypothetical protein